MHVTTALEQELRSHAQAGSLLGVGTLLWGVAVLTLRFFGGQLLPVGRPGFVLSVFVVSIVGTVLVVLSVFSLLDVAPERRLAATILLVLPGLLLEGALTAGVLVVGSEASLPAAANSGLLTWMYGVALLTGIAPLVRPVVEEEEGENGTSRDSTALEGDAGVGTGED